MYQYHAELVHIIDADTVRLMVDLGFHVSLEATVRIAGVDCPERHTLASAQTEAAAATWWAQVPDGRVLLTVTRYRGRYGRIIGRIEAPGHPLGPDLAAWLRAHGCRAYEE